MGNNHIEDKKMGKRVLAMVFSGLMLTSTVACAGTMPFVVPPCDSEAVLEVATTLAQTKDVVNPRTVRIRNIRQVTYHPDVSRTCVSTIKDMKNRNIDFFYQVTMTHGIKWVVGGVDL